MQEIEYKNFSKFINIDLCEKDSIQKLGNILIYPKDKDLNLLDSIKYLYLRNLANLNYKVKLIYKLKKKFLSFSNSNTNSNKEYYRNLLSPKRELILNRNIDWIRKFENDSQDIFASYNIQLEKISMGASGYCKPGPIRPPYNVMPEDFAQAARETGQRFAQLREKYSR